MVCSASLQTKQVISMDSISSGIPTIREELDRKIALSLDWLIASRSNGKITDEACSVASDAIFMAASGLVNDAFMEVITSIGSWLDGEQNRPALCHVFLTPEGKTLTVTWRPGADVVSLITADGTTKHQSYEDPKSARAAFDTLPAKLISRNFKEVK